MHYTTHTSTWACHNYVKHLDQPSEPSSSITFRCIFHPLPHLLYTSLSTTPLRTLQLILLNSERHLQQILLLLHMRSFQARRHTSTRRSPSIHDVLPVVMFRVIQQRLNPRLHETPRSCIQRLFLCPHNRLGIGVHVEVVLEILPGEGVELLDTCDGSRGDFVGGAVFVDSGVGLAGTDDDALDLFGRVDGVCFGALCDLWGFVGRVGDDPSEVGVAGEVFNVGASKRVTKERL